MTTWRQLPLGPLCPGLCRRRCGPALAKEIERNQARVSGQNKLSLVEIDSPPRAGALVPGREKLDDGDDDSLGRRSDLEESLSHLRSDGALDLDQSRRQTLLGLSFCPVPIPIDDGA